MNASELVLNALANTYAALDSGTPEDRDRMTNHIRGIEVREGRGSFVEGVSDRESLEAFLVACINKGARVVTHEEMEERYPLSTFGPCTYIELLVPDTYTARNGVTDMQTLLASAEAGESLNVTVRRSLHDTAMVDTDGRLVTDADGERVEVPTFEVVMNGTHADMPETNHAFMIVGPSGENDSSPMVWTWHPGPPSAAPSSQLIEALAGITVKISTQ